MTKTTTPLKHNIIIQSMVQYQYNTINSQSVNYNNPKQAEKIINRLKNLKGLISVDEIIKLKTELKLAQTGKSFILQIGNCAESLKETAEASYIKMQHKFFLETALALQEGLKKLNLPWKNSPEKVVVIGRIAGQFAKPRTNLYEEKNGCNLPAFRGEIINGFDYHKAKREANPLRMILAYLSSLSAVKHLNLLNKNSITEVFTSHEALHLPYEKSLTRNSYNLGAHMLWLGVRTIFSLEHIKYLKTIKNPIGIKVSKDISPLVLINIIKILNTTNESGKILLIVRLGEKHIEEFLPLFIEAVEGYKLNVSWLLDPMHGNTKNKDGVKIRYINEIIKEVQSFMKITAQYNLKSKGIHLEAIGSMVTECVGGISNPVSYEDIKGANSRYLTLCDPRLNKSQTLDVINSLLGKFGNRTYNKKINVNA